MTISDQLSEQSDQEDLSENEEENQDEVIYIEEYEDETTTAARIAPDTVMRNCQDLLRAGVLDSKAYKLGSQAELNDAGRDFNLRFCDQTTAGGGWTVMQNQGFVVFISVSLVISWDHLLMCLA